MVDVMLTDILILIDIRYFSAYPHLSNSRIFNPYTADGGPMDTPILSQLPDLIATRFQRLYLCFQGRAFQLNEYKQCRTKVEGTGSGKSKMAENTTEMHIPRLPELIKINAIPTAIPMFLGSDIPMRQVSTSTMKVEAAGRGKS